MKLETSEIFIYGIPEIDDVHAQMVQMLNAIGDYLEKGQVDAALGDVIHLIAVERKHAKYENDLLHQYDADKVPGHKDQHDRLSALLNDIRQALEEPDPARGLELHRQLTEAFLEDLLMADLPFKSVLQNSMLGR